MKERVQCLSLLIPFPFCVVHSLLLVLYKDCCRFMVTFCITIYIIDRTSTWQDIISPNCQRDHLTFWNWFMYSDSSLTYFTAAFFLFILFAQYWKDPAHDASIIFMYPRTGPVTLVGTSSGCHSYNVSLNDYQVWPKVPCHFLPYISGITWQSLC